MFNIQEAVKKLPKKPGVYLMFNQEDQIIYVGKAINLRNRVRSYFNGDKNKGKKVQAMVKNIIRFEYILVENEVEALILESNLIKENRPRYNVLMRDDKSYPYIKITNEKFPRLLKVRRIIKDGASYFGPFPNAYAVNDIIDLLQSIYPLRTCKLDFDQGQRLERPCLNYFIKRCDAPCIDNADEGKYMEDIAKVETFLRGKDDGLVGILEKKMKEAAENYEFEMAAKYRDQIQSIHQIMEKQKISSAFGQDIDLIAMAKAETVACIQVFFMRNGRIVDRNHFILSNELEEEKGEIISSFIKQFYMDSSYIPREILVDQEISDRTSILEWLEDMRGSKVNLRIPQRGKKVDTLKMVRENAEDMLKKHLDKKIRRERSLPKGALDLKNLLELQKMERIEAYDISNTSGVLSVGSMIVFEEGEKAPKEYRKFKIKTIEGANDYGSLNEVLTRRFRRGIAEKEKGMVASGFGRLPDLIIMDGGKGQVNIAYKVLAEMKLDIPVIGLVKDQFHKTRGIIYENKEYDFPVTSSIYRFIFAIQEEAHRFAINYHRKLREKTMTKSVLDEISGIGPARRKALMDHFKSIEKIKKASISELMEVDKINKQNAENIQAFFKEDVKK